MQEIRRGRATDSALTAFARRIKSPIYERSFLLIVEGMRRGASLAQVLDSIAADTREVQRIARERAAVTMMQSMFIFVTCGLAGPMVAGMVIKIVEIFQAQKIISGLTPEVFNTISLIILVFMGIQAVIGSLAVGVMRHGEMTKGLRYSTFLVPLAMGVYYLTGKLLAILGVHF